MVERKTTMAANRSPVSVIHNWPRAITCPHLEDAPQLGLSQAERLTDMLYETPYRQALRAARKADGTVEQRIGDLRRFQNATHVEPFEAAIGDLRSYLSEGARHWAPEYMKRIRSTFRDFYSWLQGKGLRADNPATGLAAITNPCDSLTASKPSATFENSCCHRNSTKERIVSVRGPYCAARLAAVPIIAPSSALAPATAIPSGSDRSTNLLTSGSS